jgi:hypothetical protein
MRGEKGARGTGDRRGGRRRRRRREGCSPRVITILTHASAGSDPAAKKIYMVYHGPGAEAYQ